MSNSVPKSMRAVTALAAKNRFGELLDMAQREPVSIEKHGRPVAVVMSSEEYEELEALKRKALRMEIEKGLEDIRASRVVGGAEAFEQVRKRLD